MEKPATMKILGEKLLPEAVVPGLLSYCPSMDLVALATIDQQIHIYRLNSQQVYNTTQRNAELKVESISWKPSGQLLAIAWSDGSVKLVGAESTKIVHQFFTEDKSGITCIGWASNLTRKVSDSQKSQNQYQTWGGLLSQNGVELEAKEALNLPRDLSQVDIETSLPKLSILASGGTSEDVFSSRASLDALFRPFDPNDTRAVDVMVVGTRQGDLHLSIYDSFVIGSFKSPVNIKGTSARLVLHASHAQYSTHSLLLASAGNQSRLFFVPMDLRFVSASSDYLPLLASRSSAIQNLLRYIHEVHRLMVAEWESTRDLPDKFLRNVADDLKEKDNRDIVQALYHSVATGHTFPVVKDWLVDQLAERGHKRWDKAVTSGLQNLKQLVHENMLPALDRCSVILSRFAGIAKFRGSNDTTGFTSQQIRLITDTIACLHLVASKILIQAVDELELFTAFSAWLRYEIDKLASEGSSTQDDDVADKESAIDHSKVLLYIQTAMKTSPLGVYLNKSTEEDLKMGQENLEQGVPMFDLLNKQIQKMERGHQYLTYLPQQQYLAAFLSAQAGKVFAQIAEAEKRNVLFGDALEIGTLSNGSVMDMSMTKLERSLCRTHIFFAQRERQGFLQIIRATLSIEKGISTFTATESSSLQLGAGEIKDFKNFGNSILALWSLSGTTHLLSIPYQQSGAHSTQGDFVMHYHPHKPDSPSNIYNFTDEEVTRLFKKYEVPEGNGQFVPEQIQIRNQMPGRKGEETIVKVVLLGQDRRHYKVLTLVKADSDSGKDKDGDVSMPSGSEGD